MYSETFKFPMSSIGFHDMSLKEYANLKRRADIDEFLGMLESVENLKVGKFLSKGSFGTVFEYPPNRIIKMISIVDREEILQMFDEIVVQFIINYILRHDSECKKKLSNNTMARVPLIYKIGYTIDNNNKWYLYIMMEKCQTTIADHITDTMTKLPEKKILQQSGAILYQLMSLLEVLGKKIKYNHCDLKTNNAMITFKNKNYFYTSLIDFGYSRIQLGNTILQLDKSRSKQPYIPGRDIFMFLYWFHGDMCGTFKNMEDGCGEIPEILHATILQILKKSKINFKKFQEKIKEDQNYWRDLYYILNKPKCVGSATELTPVYVKVISKYLIKKGNAIRNRGS